MFPLIRDVRLNGPRRRGALLAQLLAAGLACPGASFAEPAAPARSTGANQPPTPSAQGPAPDSAGAAPAPAADQPTIYIREFRVLGSRNLPRVEVEDAVYPFLGPGRTFGDVEKASGALQKLYHDKGFSTATVGIPEQTGRGGLVYLQVYEGVVGKLRVKGAKYFLPSQIKAHARSLAEGKVLNFDNVKKDIVALNQWPDRRVTPDLKPTGEPGVFDIDLNVEDKLPLHGSVELNNRKSANTTDLRLNASISYSNLWQRGHSVGFSYQLSPEDTSEVKVYSGFYTWRLADPDWLSFMLTGTKQDSNISTLGGAAVAGRGEILGLRAIATLPGMEDFYHSLSVGLDYKHFDQNIIVGSTTDVTPITYYPLSLNWDGTWLHHRDVAVPGVEGAPDTTRREDLGTTQLSAGVTMGIRGWGSEAAELDRNRFNADANFVILHADLSHEHNLPHGWQLYGRVHGQIADQPLVNNEQLGGGGVGTVRGYLEAEALGDSGLFGTFEVRSPSLLRTTRAVPGQPPVKTGNEWRIYGFVDAGELSVHEPLPEQDSSFRLSSIGLGSQLDFREHFHGLLELAYPLTTLNQTRAHDARVDFRVWADF